MPKVPYPYEVNGKLVTENGSLIQICSLSNCSLLPSLTVLYYLGPFEEDYSKIPLQHLLSNMSPTQERIYGFFQLNEP